MPLYLQRHTITPQVAIRKNMTGSACGDR